MLAVVYGGLLILAQRHHVIPPIHHSQELSGSALYWISNIFLIQWITGQGLLNAGFWSLVYEVVFYVMVGMILLVAKWMSARWNQQAGLYFLSVTVAALTVESLLWQIVTGSGGAFPMDRWYQFGLGGLFFLAVEIRSNALAGYSVKLHMLNRMMVATCVVLTVVFASTRSEGGGTIDHPSSRMQSWVVILYLVIVWVLRHTERHFLHRRFLIPLFWLGSFSYSLYLVHPYFLGVVDVPARRLGFVGNLYLVSWGLQIVVAVLASWVFYLAIERHFVSSRQKRRIATELAEAQ